jgi:polysaccharide pyruvyl transferase WcaK-like protein
MGIYSPDKHHYSSDDALNLSASTDTALERWIADVGPYISLHAHYWRLTPDEWQSFSHRLAQALDTLISRTGYRVVMLPMIFGPSHELFDARALLDIAEQCKTPEKILMAPGDLKPKQLRLLYGRAASAIVCRHHSMVFSLAAGVPTTALYFDAYYRQKIQGVAKRFGDLCSVLDAASCTAESIAENVLGRLPQGDAARP